MADRMPYAVCSRKKAGDNGSWQYDASTHFHTGTLNEIKEIIENEEYQAIIDAFHMWRMGLYKLPNVPENIMEAPYLALQQFKALKQAYDHCHPQMTM